ncbi:MAG TPA: hypothetical protein ENN40_08630 [Candidatus Aminicenantes bacterium]|nr:hypothetical protein [Candidatus Aminicenantes bacterium]
MKHLDLNMASSRRPDWLRFWGVAVFLLGVSALLVWNGWRALNHESEPSGEAKLEMRSLREADRNHNARMETISAEIQQLQKRWDAQVRFANALINRKTYSFLNSMNQLEKALSGRVFLQRLTVDQNRPQRLEMEVVAPSFSDLIVAYRQLSAFRLEVNSEVRDRDGQYRVSINLRIKP